MIPFFENRTEKLQAILSENLCFPMHHHVELELFYVLEGQVRITVRTQEQKLSAGHLAIIFPNQTHSYEALGEANAILVICDLSQVGGNIHPLSKCHPENPFLLPEQLHENVPYALHQLLSEWHGNCDMTAGAALVQLILARILSNLVLKPNKNTDSHELTYQIVQYIAQHFQEPLSLSSLAQALCISKYHLSRVFSEKMGLRFNDYLNSIRLAYALQQIQNTDLPITEIGMDVGFESPSTFYRAFREHYHTTPLQHRYAGRLHTGESRR